MELVFCFINTFRDLGTVYKQSFKNHFIFYKKSVDFYILKNYLCALKKHSVEKFRFGVLHKSE